MTLKVLESFQEVQGASTRCEANGVACVAIGRLAVVASGRRIEGQSGLMLLNNAACLSCSKYAVAGWHSCQRYIMPLGSQLVAWSKLVKATQAVAALAIHPDMLTCVYADRGVAFCCLVHR
jgi:hypothetical protein